MATLDFNVKCPTCSAAMVKRTATKGPHAGKDFFGCSRFPRCKGTRGFQVTRTPEVDVNPNPNIPEIERNPFFKNAIATAKQSDPKNPLTEKQKVELNKLRDRLLNVSSRNRSIRLNRLDKKSAFDLSLLNGFGTTVTNELIEHCLTSEAEIKIFPQKTDGNQRLWDSLSPQLTHLHRNISEIYQEKGLHDLYIGFPFLCGKPLGSNTVVQAPIFLIPVKLEKKVPKKGAPAWTLTPSADQKAHFNKTLFYALAKLCNLTVNQDIFEEEVPTELYGKKNFIEWTQQLLNNYGLITKIHIDALDQEFDRLREFTVNDLPEDFEAEGLQICQSAILGHFPQSNSSLQKDYEAFLEMDQSELDGITFFLTDEYLDQTQQPEELGSFKFSSSAAEEISTIDSRPEKDNFFLLPSDSSQDRIILELSKPSTDGIVLWGPPGTGKSQTIVNLISDCISKGKTVLLVSQKRAALDVVYDRLAAKGMRSMTALVHDAKEDRKQLYSALAQSCNRILGEKEYHTDPTSEIEAVTQTLKDVSKAYTDSKYGKMSGKIYSELAAYRGPILNKMDSQWATSNYQKVMDTANAISGYQELFHSEIPTALIKNRRDFSTFGPELKWEIGLLLIDLKSETATRAASIQSYLSGGHVDIQNIDQFKTAFEQREQFKGLLRYFNSDFRRLNRYVNSEIKESGKLLQALNAKALRLLSMLVELEQIKASSLLSASEKIVWFIERFEPLDKYFDTLKTLDLQRNRLPNDLKDIAQTVSTLDNSSRVAWSEIFKFSVLSTWNTELERRHPVLSAIKSSQVEILRLRLKKLLELKTEFNVGVLQQRMKNSLSSEAGKQFARSLAVEVERKRNIPSVRKLNEKFSGQAHFNSILPVWLVSPETVSDAFPLKKGLFDVVIFDEASQCTVENGLPAIFRGKQVIIAGDEKQLQPNRLFESSVEEDSTEDNHAASEPSLLALAKKALRYQSMMLEWHYRSKHQELVMFSNEVFYGGRMKIAPNVVPFVKGNKPAIQWHSVEGFWSERTNDQEAHRVLELIRSTLLSDTPPTVGVITFNANQKNHILDLIDQTIQADPEFANLMEQNKKLPLDERLFVKNIENVQGDERDVIIFSIAYAPAHPGGRVQQHFGLLNKPGGENRLNVAVTRAISRIHIVSSINPETDINTSMSAHAGPKIFQKYLCYAKAVADENFDRLESILAEINPNLSTRPQTGHLVFDSPFEEDVFNELSKHGFEVHSQVGQSGFRIDLAVVDPSDPSRYLLGIECDGAMYHSGVSIRERDVFRQRFLESRGWTIHRIWSPSWRESRRQELQKIIGLIRSIQSTKTPATGVSNE